ncbi:MAG: LysR family transcriptional regulator [Spirochaetaceae bacterium]|jgi:hypothetical protein|nr:LysR family transcriptional regulator [Spirochaetaceae bacterium]
MDVREYKYLLTVIKYGSISKAAEEVHVSQPSLSAYSKNLEKSKPWKRRRKLPKRSLTSVPTSLPSREWNLLSKLLRKGKGGGSSRTGGLQVSRLVIIT